MKYHPNILILQVVMLPIDSVGDEGEINNVLKVLREAFGVRGAVLFFKNTAVRLYYDPDCTNLETIYTVLLSLNNGVINQANHQDALSGAVTGDDDIYHEPFN
jgi:hypothetical protein